MNTNKVYVDVTAVFSKEGQLKPVSVMWQDGHIYEIQRITDIRRAASLKAGGVGMRYTCIIDGKETHLFYEDNNMWFVEGRAEPDYVRWYVISWLRDQHMQGHT